MKRGLLFLGAMVFSLGIAEGISRIVDHGNTLIPDAALMSSMPSNGRDHDARGFRNEPGIRTAEIVAIGDSQTWGVNVRRDEAWPQVLGRISGRTTYNMAIGGYGPVQYWLLSRKALELHPKLVIIGLYFGNDLFEAYWMTYRNPTHKAFRSPSAPDLSGNTLQSKVFKLYSETVDIQRESRGWPKAELLAERLALGRMLLKLVPKNDSAKFADWKSRVLAHPDRYTVYDQDGVRTVLTTAYRLVAVDLEEPPVREGLAVTKRALTQSKELLHGAGVRLMVALIPTKESVFAAPYRSDPGDAWRRLVEMEARARGEIIAFCRQNKIDTVDLLPALSRSVASGVNPYREAFDGHPAAAGYRVIANELRSLVERE